MCSKFKIKFHKNGNFLVIVSSAYHWPLLLLGLYSKWIIEFIDPICFVLFKCLDALSAIQPIAFEERSIKVQIVDLRKNKYR